MFEKIIKLSAQFPQIPFNSSALKRPKLFYPDLDEKRYIGFCVFSSLFFTILIGAIMIFSGEENNLGFETLIYLILFFCMMAGLFLNIPNLQIKKITTKLENELPLSIRTFALFLQIKMPFYNALKEIGTEEGEFSRQIRIVLKEAEQGVSLKKALLNFSSRFNSPYVKRAISQIIIAYEFGSTGIELERISADMLFVQQHKVKEYANKSAIFGLVFVIVTCVFPTFFLIYSFTSSIFGTMTLDNTALAIVMLLIFPTIASAILILSKASSPQSVFSKKTDKKYLLLTIMVAAFYVLAVTYAPKEFIYPAIFISSLIFFAAVYPGYKKEKNKEDTEIHLPDALFALSSLSPSATTRDIFFALKSVDCAPLSLEAQISIKQINSNVKDETVIRDFCHRIDSTIVTHYFEIAKQIISVNSFAYFAKLGQDAMEFTQINRDRQNILSMQKYTLIFGAFLIPVIIKLSLNMLKGVLILSKSNISFAFFDSIIAPYLAIYALLSSIYIADSESKNSQSIVYFFIMFLISLIVYNISIF
ncbi:MAG: type II secretion system F family protein [Candidatus Micrarchaeota archaeon]